MSSIPFSLPEPSSLSLPPTSDLPNYLILLALYTLQGIPIGLSMSIPLLLQTSLPASQLYSFQAIFSLCSWPFSLKLLWAPLVDATGFPFLERFGKRKSWIMTLQFLAGVLMFAFANNISNFALSTTPNIKALTGTFFCLYFLMATQDIAVDGWALTMLSKPNRQFGPVCNSIGQNLGQAISYTGFIALNDDEVGGWIRDKLSLTGVSLPGSGGLVSLSSFMRFSGLGFMVVTAAVTVFKKERSKSEEVLSSQLAPDDDDEDAELDSSELGVVETYRRLFSTLKLPCVQTLLLILLTYRLPTSLSDNVKNLKYLELGLPKSALALMSPTVILPLGILTPILASRFYSGRPLAQFLFAYKLRVSLVALLDVLSLAALEKYGAGATVSWILLVLSTVAQTVCSSMQFNAQMSFFSTRVDKNIGGSYMTLLNTFANLGGTWPAGPMLWIAGEVDYYKLQLGLSLMGLLWVSKMAPRVEYLANTDESEWRSKEGRGREAGKNV